MSKRKALSKKTRFEVFKRDKFTCQYCGGKAPDVLLQCDHIVAVAKGGKNDIVNLITSCEDCNSGKSDRALTDDAVVSKRRAQLDALAERREQLEMMVQWQRGLVDLEGLAVRHVATMFGELAPGFHLNDHGLSSLRKQLATHGVEAVITCMRAALGEALRFEDGVITPDSAAEACRLWERKLKWARMRQRDPIGCELRYIRGILRRRFSLRDWKLNSTLDSLRYAHERGLSIEALKQLALSASTRDGWQSELDAMVNRVMGGEDA
jgi:HNH endonuclease